MSSKKKKSFWKRRFKMILLRNDTLEEVSNLSVKPLHILLLSIATTIVIIAITVSLIFYTPLRYMVPGYAEITENRVYMDLYDRVQELERTTENQSLYIDKMQNLLSGEHNGIEDVRDARVNDKQKKGEIVNKVVEDDSLRKKVSLNGQSALSLPRVQSPDDDDDNELLERALVPPIKGIVSASYNRNEDHYGIDILAPAETPVKSIDRGMVIAADWTMETGYTIGIQHRDNLISYYKHNSSLLKRAGDLVEPGEAIAIIGNTGHLTSGPHLHFELWYDGHALDPAQYINFQE